MARLEFIWMSAGNKEALVDLLGQLIRIQQTVKTLRSAPADLENEWCERQHQAKRDP